MEFRPCIDIHNGKVKQIVGSSLRDAGDQASENFVSGQDAPFYARMYQSRGIRGGHIILLNAKDSPYYEETKNQALAALRAYPGGIAGRRRNYRCQCVRISGSRSLSRDCDFVCFPGRTD